MWRDLERLCDRYGLRWRKPGVFPKNSVLAARVAMRVEHEPFAPAFVRALFGAAFVDDADISEPAVVLRVLAPHVQDPELILRSATEPANKEALRARTDLALQRGVFGAPTFFAGDELFFGQDRLTDALDWSARPRPRHANTTTLRQ
jgi:2-hydroxychromene-2-carboxylate isomerase